MGCVKQTEYQEQVEPKFYIFESTDGIIIEEMADSQGINQVKIHFKESTFDNLDAEVTVKNLNPLLKLKKWNGEANLSVYYNLKGKNKKRLIRDLFKTKTKKAFSFDSDSETVNLYPLNISDGGVEFEVELKSKPISNKLYFNLDFTDLEFYYQPPLNEEKHEEGLTCNETDCWDKEGNIHIHRPENVVGSYAVYHSYKVNNQYRAGKLFHIYSPKIIDSKGKCVWGKLNITNNFLTIEIPLEFLNKAIYPVKVDPTFGYDTKGSTYVTSDYKDIDGSWFNCPESGTADSISAYHDDYGDGAENAIYKKSDNSFVGHTTSGSGSAIQDWHTFNFVDPKPSLSGGTDYWLVLWATDYTYFFYDSADDGRGGHQNNVDKWPDPWNPTTNNRKFSIYCTYTAGGTTTTTTSTSTSTTTIAPYNPISNIINQLRRRR